MRLRLRRWSGSVLRLLHLLLRRWQLLRWWVRGRLGLDTALLRRRRLRGRGLRWVRLRCSAALVRRRTWLRLGSDTLRFMHIGRLCGSALGRVGLARLARSTGMLGLLGLLLRLNLLGLLEGEKLLLLRRHRLAVWHLLQTHLQINRSHCRVGLHGRNLGGVQALGTVGKRNGDPAMLLMRLLLLLLVLLVLLLLEHQPLSHEMLLLLL